MPPHEDVYVGTAYSTSSGGYPGLRLTYVGGHPTLVSRSDAGTIFLHRGKHNVSIPAVTVTSCQWVPQSQAVNMGGGLSIGGAIVGDLLFGPIGAIVGSRKHSQIKTVRDDVIQLTVQPEKGLGYTVIFSANATEYQHFRQTVGI